MFVLSETISQLSILIYNSKKNIKLILILLASIWLFNIINWFSGSILNVLGNIPRSRRGMLGIVFSWLPHANFNHLFFNSIPLFVLSLLIISYNKRMFFDATLMIILLEGAAVWLFARKGNHIGASSLVAGYFGFMLIFAYKTATVVSVFLGFIVLYYFGGILLSLFPNEMKTSWESHLFGFLAGISTFLINSTNLFSFYNYNFWF